MITGFQFILPTKIVFGPGVSESKLDALVEGGRVLIISDPFLFNNGTAQRIGSSLKGKEVFYFSQITPNPSCDTADEAAAFARKVQADYIVGLGGGSALDVSKIVACLVGEEESIRSYFGGTKTLGKRKSMLICIPTTAGTGSEVTNVGVFTDTLTGKKLPMVQDSFWADAAILDPELTCTLPPQVTASTGMDAFCHAIEAYWNRNSQPVCDWMAVSAMKLILENLLLAYQQPEHTEARSNLMLASLTAGMAFSQTRTTGIHALSFPLTAEFGVSHGAACAVSLPAFIRLCACQDGGKLGQLASALGFSSPEELAKGVESLMGQLGMETRLSRMGVLREDLEHLAEVGLQAAVIHLTPAEMNQESVCKLLSTIF